MCSSRLWLALFSIEQYWFKQQSINHSCDFCLNNLYLTFKIKYLTWNVSCLCDKILRISENIYIDFQSACINIACTVSPFDFQVQIANINIQSVLISWIFRFVHVSSHRHVNPAQAYTEQIGRQTWVEKMDGRKWLLTPGLLYVTRLYFCLLVP